MRPHVTIVSSVGLISCKQSATKEWPQAAPALVSPSGAQLETHAPCGRPEASSFAERMASSHLGTTFSPRLGSPACPGGPSASSAARSDLKGPRPPSGAFSARQTAPKDRPPLKAG